MSVNSRIPSAPHSRPQPEHFTPPNGWVSDLPAVFTATVPDRIRRAMATAAGIDAAYTEAARPNGVSLAIRTASSTSP
jgi:hypothetical protein